MSNDLEAKAHNERRLGLLIMENKSGPALAGGVTHLRAAAEAWEQAGWPQRKAGCLVDLGKLNTKRQAHHEAAEAYEEAARILDAADNAEKEASDAHAGAGCALRAVGKIEESVRHLRKALKLSTKVNDLLRKAEHQMELSASLIDAGEGDAAIEAAEAALKTFTDYRKGQQRARCHEQLGQASARLDRHTEAAQHFEESAQINMELGRRFEATETLSHYADMESKRGQHQSALDILDRCLQIHEQDHNRAMIAVTTRLKGMVHAAKGDTRAARECYTDSLDLGRGLKDHEGQARALYLLGALENKGGDVTSALETLAQAQAQAEEAGNLKIKERVLAAVAKIQRKCELHEDALTTMHDWVEVLKELGERQEQLRVLGSMASVHQERGALVEAEAHLRRLISVCNQAGDEPERLYAHHGLAVLLSKRLQHREAGEHYRQALVGYRRMFGDDRSERQSKLLATLHYQYASELLREGQADDAIQQFEAALSLPGQDENQRARVLVGMGNAQRLMGDEEAASESFSQAAELCEQQGDMRATSIIRKATTGHHSR
jgi:tetratricopeptide (TPR) repeat protein